MTLQPIRKKSAEVEAAEVLRDHVIGGGVRPGSRLTELRLAGALGLSRATIRAALHQLANEGLVVKVPYTGWTVASLGSADAWELYTLRATLEGLGARLIAENLDAKKTRDLQRAFEALVAACEMGDEILVVDRDFGLHTLIVALSGHRRLREQYRLIEQQIRLYIAWSDGLMPSRADIIETHRPIIEAIVAGDGLGAERILRHHNESAGRILVRFLDAAASEENPGPENKDRASDADSGFSVRKTG